MKNTRIRLTAGRVAALACPADKSQVFLWDTDAPALLLRATPKGRKTYVFESRLHGKTIRRTIGTPDTWTLAQARDEARRLQVLVDGGIDPREEAHRQREEAIALQEQEAARAVTVGQAWAAYVRERTPRWGAYHLRDHRRMTGPDGPLYSLLEVRLAELDVDALKVWAQREGQQRPTSARLAWRLLRAFLNWCAEDRRFAPVTPSPNPAAARKVRERLGVSQAKRDVLLKEQMPAWFSAVQGMRNVVQSAYLQILLLTGARPGELLSLQWEDVNTKWRGLTMRDKAQSKGGEDGTREIPLTPYVWHLLASLPRRGPYVFAGTSGGPMSRPHRAHVKACAVAGIEGLTLHGLRRSFKTLSEWLELPAGVVAQIMGHRPSATAEKHYTVRPLDLLRIHHEKLEAWMLEEAGVQFDAGQRLGTLRVVSGA